MNCWYSLAIEVNCPSNPCRYRHVDLAVIDQVFSGILLQYGHEFVVWRIHRRCDKGLHKVKLQFFADDTSFNQVNGAAGIHQYLNALRTNNIITSSACARDLRDGNPLTNIGDICDDNWPPEIKPMWPYYAQACSQALLGTIDYIKHNVNIDLAITILVQQLQNYALLQQNIDNLWFKMARPIYLHHIGAIFGYAPAEINIPINL